MRFRMLTKTRHLLVRLLGEHRFYSLGYYYLLLQPAFRHSVLGLRALKDRHRGQRCFIIGNGPSLNRMDLSPLRDEVTFGLNRIYLMFPSLGFSTTYYLAVNKLVIEQCGDEILSRVPGLKFISYDARRWIGPASNLLYLYSRAEPHFFANVSKGIWQGATVTYSALQVAFFLGFQQVILIGVDHSYESKGQPHSTVVSSGTDPDHFDPHYFGAGFRWQLPDLELSEQAYRLARQAYERAGREILDATVDGKLTVFRKVEFTSLFQG
jgi:hypothetical protein